MKQGLTGIINSAYKTPYSHNVGINHWNFPLRSQAWQKLLHTCLRFQNKPSHPFLRIAWNASRRNSKDKLKAEFWFYLSFEWMQDI